jgi:hypothetical protein
MGNRHTRSQPVLHLNCTVEANARGALPPKQSPGFGNGPHRDAAAAWRPRENISAKLSAGLLEQQGSSWWDWMPGQARHDERLETTPDKSTQRPRQAGLRFSENAFTPSRKSSLP